MAEIPKYEPGGDRPPKRDKPPRTASRRAGTTKARRNFKPISDLETSLNNLFGAIGLMFMVRGDAHCAGVIADGSPNLVSSWCRLAERNDGVRRVLEAITATETYGGLVMSTAAIAIPIMHHHGVLIPHAFPIELFNSMTGVGTEQEDEEAEPDEEDVAPVMNGQGPTIVQPYAVMQ